MDAETRRRAVIDLALEHSNLKQKAKDFGVSVSTALDGVQMDSEDFIRTFKGTKFRVKRRKSERFPYEAYFSLFSSSVFAILTEEQYQELGVAADE